MREGNQKDYGYENQGRSNEQEPLSVPGNSQLAPGNTKRADLMLCGGGTAAQSARISLFQRSVSVVRASATYGQSSEISAATASVP